MKHIIIEGGDRLGKSSLIEKIAHHYNFDNVIIRHFGKPPKIFQDGITPFKFQVTCFDKEGYLLEQIRLLEEDIYCYYNNIVLWNRSHLGEYVYGQMFRGENPKEIENFLMNFEEKFLLVNPDTYLILLTADPEFFLSKEDGKSFSKNIIEKTQELKLFNEIFEKSSIYNKLIVKVNNGDNFIPKDEIFQKFH